MKRIVMPEAMSRNANASTDSAPWGLSEFIVERVLSAPDIFSSSEACDRVASLYHKFSELKGPKQKGAEILLTDAEYEFLLRRYVIGVQLFASSFDDPRRGPGAIPPHLVLDFAIYSRALYAATSEAESKEQST